MGFRKRRDTETPQGDTEDQKVHEASSSPSDPESLKQSRANQHITGKVGLQVCNCHTRIMAKLMQMLSAKDGDGLL